MVAGAPLVVRVSAETRRKIDALARSRGRSLNYVLGEAIERYLAEEEWLIDEINAAVAEADAPAAVFHNTDEVMRHMDAIIAETRTRTRRGWRTSTPSHTRTVGVVIGH